MLLLLFVVVGGNTKQVGEMGPGRARPRAEILPNPNNAKYHPRTQPKHHLVLRCSPLLRLPIYDELSRGIKLVSSSQIDRLCLVCVRLKIRVGAAIPSIGTGASNIRNSQPARPCLMVSL